MIQNTGWQFPKNGRKADKTDEFWTLQELFDEYVAESISDEEVERVLAPVIAMIRAGAFDRVPYDKNQNIDESRR